MQTPYPVGVADSSKGRAIYYNIQEQDIKFVGIIDFIPSSGMR